MDVSTALSHIASELQNEDAKDDARYLLSHILQQSFTWLKTWPEAKLSDEQINSLAELIKRRKKGEPIAYITGERDFWSLTLKTNTSTLIPRPETELLVEKSLEFLEKKPSNNILDLGTGTGAIALAIAKERSADQIIASDFQEGAVMLARENCKLNQIDNVKVVQSNWYENILKYKFDLIVSNPPYVEENDPHLQQGDLVFEPNSALVAGDQGLADIKVIISQSVDYLEIGGQLMIEHGYNQGSQIQSIFAEYDFSEIETVKDLNGVERVTKGIKLD